MTFGEGIDISDNRYKYNGKGLLKNPGWFQYNIGTAWIFQ